MKTPRKRPNTILLCSTNFFKTRQMDELAPQELNKFLSEFLITVRKKEDHEEYEPNSLRAFFASFERHLKKKTRDFAL